MSAREIDPRLAEMLASAARRKGSALFRVSAAQRQRQPFERVRVSRATAGLGVAERELVDLHRAALARLLHEAFFLAVDEAWKEQPIERLFAMPEPAGWRARGTAALDELPAHPTLEDGLALLGRCLGASDPAQLEHPRDLLLVALRLEDTENARNDVALDLIGAGEPRSARRLLQGILANAPSDLHAWLAWLNVAYSFTRERDYRSALDAYVRAKGLPAARLAAWVGTFISALLAGDSVEAARMSRELEERANEWSRGRSWLLEQLRSADVTSEEKRAGRACFERARSHLGSIAEDIGVALL